MAYTNSGPDPQVFASVQAALKRVGIKVTGKQQDESVYYDSYIGAPATVAEQKIGIASIGWAPDYPSGNGFLTLLVDGARIQAQGTTNFVSVNDDVLNGLIEQSATAGRDEQAGIFRELDKADDGTRPLRPVLLPEVVAVPQLPGDQCGPARRSRHATTSSTSGVSDGGSVLRYLLGRLARRDHRCDRGQRRDVRDLPARAPDDGPGPGLLLHRQEHQRGAGRRGGAASSGSTSRWRSSTGRSCPASSPAATSATGRPKCTARRRASATRSARTGPCSR